MVVIIVMILMINDNSEDRKNENDYSNFDNDW